MAGGSSADLDGTIRVTSALGALQFAALELPDIRAAYPVRLPTDGADVTLAPVRQLRPGRGRIVDEARRLFSTRGYEGTPLRAVSDALG